MDSRRDPLVLAGYAILAAVVVLLDPPAILAIVIAAPLVLLAPGLALVMALDIDGDTALPGRRLILSIALSIATVALGGILVNTVAPLTKASWIVWLLAFTCICCAVTVLRAGQAWATPFPRPAQWLSRQPRNAGLWPWVATGVAVVLLLAGAAVLTEVTSRNAYYTPLVELSMLPAPERGDGWVELSVANRSDHTEDLLLTVTDDSGSSSIENLKLPPSGSWKAEEPVSQPGIRAVLTKAGRSKPIGEVALNGP
jgi:hypothetical protein